MDDHHLNNITKLKKNERYPSKRNLWNFFIIWHLLWQKNVLQAKGSAL